MPESPESFFDFAKEKKNEVSNFFLLTAKFNHPHRLVEVNFSGSINLTIDSRLFAGVPPQNGSSAYVQTITENYSLAPKWTRYFEDKCPIQHTVGPEIDKKQFGLFHQPKYPWRFITDRSPISDPKKIGSISTSYFTYNNNSWQLTQTDEQDIFYEFGLNIDSGGDPVSGGKAPDSQENMARIDLPILNFIMPTDLFIYRPPWDDTWDPEAAAYSTAFNDYVDAGNAANGGGYSGSCSVSLNFVSQ